MSHNYVACRTVFVDTWLKKAARIFKKRSKLNTHTTMAAEGLEKITEVPVEFFKDGSAFVKKCQKPTKKGM